MMIKRFVDAMPLDPAGRPRSRPRQAEVVDTGRVDLGEGVAIGGRGPCPQLGRNDRCEHPVRGSVVQVVDPVGVGQPVECGDAARSEHAETPMDVAVVHECVRDAVERDPDSERDQRVHGGVEAEPEPEHHDRGEHHREPVVAFPPRGAAGAVMAAVEPLADAVHHPAVRRRGHRLHQHEPADDDQRKRGR